MSTRRQRELWLCYVINKRQHLENEVKQLQANVRYREIDAVDCMELMLAKEKLHNFNEFVSVTTEIFKILSADELDNQ